MEQLGLRPLVITGATGFLGRHLVARLAPLWKAEIFAIGREPGAAPAGVRVVRGDLRDPAVFDGTIPPGSVVVHLAYDGEAGHDANVGMAVGLARACVRARVERLVHVSTANVVGVRDEAWVTETTLSRATTDYQRTKLAVEDSLVRETDGRLVLVTLRPTSIFGRGGASLRKLARDLRTRFWAINYTRSSLFGRRPMNLVPVETCVAAIEFALSSARAAEDRLYLVSEDESPDNNFRDVERVLRMGLGLSDYPMPPLPLPAGWLRLALLATGRLVVFPATRFSGARLRSAGFLAPISFSAALDRFARQAAGEQD
ncbi:MAG TPA: NAD-dependent epimerase/dehydratase family protein [Vicinamibacterales bacterium]|nr:NAD-dependent epimerase/dehydratase family protein [Vicinamibacterales bacterium]